MSLKHKTMLQAFASHFEIACILGVIVIFTDMVWLAHDIYEYGLSIWYIIVLSGLSIGAVGTMWIIWIHNRCFSRELRHTQLEIKLKAFNKKLKQAKKHDK